jgi:CRISPR/Cas system-associated exonuclease Cas4 (RecB family)
METLKEISVGEISEKIVEGRRKDIRRYPQYVTRSSDIGHPCEKYLVLSITNWQDRQLHDPGLEFVFSGGRKVEELAIEDLEKAGFKVYKPEPDSSLKEVKPAITGHLDLRVDFGDGVVRTLEIKGLNMYDFNALNSLEDFFNSKKVHVRKYPAQLMCYLYFKGEDKGYFYLKSLPGFQFKIIPVKLDYDYMESILQKTERIEKHIAEGTMPEGINDLDVCPRCPFWHICLPELQATELELITDPELEDKLERWNEIKEYYKEYRELDSDIKKSVNGHEKLSIGNFLIQGKLIERKGYIPKPVEDSSYWKYKIVKI